MDRLTFSGFPYEETFIKKLQAYEDTGLEPEEIQANKEEIYITTLFKSQVQDAEESIRIAEARRDGRLIVLPCKVGDTVWFNTYKNNATKCVGIQPHEVKCVNVQFLTDGAEIPQWEIGKTVFLTREEAERALEEEQG